MNECLKIKDNILYREELNKYLQDGEITHFNLVPSHYTYYRPMRYWKICDECKNTHNSERFNLLIEDKFGKYNKRYSKTVRRFVMCLHMFPDIPKDLYYTRFSSKYNIRATRCFNSLLDTPISVSESKLEQYFLEPEFQTMVCESHKHLHNRKQSWINEAIPHLPSDLLDIIGSYYIITNAIERMLEEIAETYTLVKTSDQIPQRLISKTQPTKKRTITARLMSKAINHRKKQKICNKLK